jgi:hypothetical protein
MSAFHCIEVPPFPKTALKMGYSTEYVKTDVFTRSRSEIFRLSKADVTQLSYHSMFYMVIYMKSSTGITPVLI